MTLIDLIDMVQRRTGVQDRMGEIVVELNRYMDSISRDLMIPQAFGDVTGIVGEFQLPANARDGGLLEIRDAASGVNLPIMNVAQANRMYADWMDWDVGETRFVVVDQKMLSSDVRPAPLPDPTDPRDYSIRYVVAPTAMSATTDTPFSGRFPQYDEVLAFAVMRDLFAQVGNQLGLQRAEMEYQRLLRELYEYGDPGPVYANNPLWNSVNQSSYYLKRPDYDLEE